MTKSMVATVKHSVEDADSWKIYSDRHHHESAVEPSLEEQAIGRRKLRHHHSSKADVNDLDAQQESIYQKQRQKQLAKDKKHRKKPLRAHEKMLDEMYPTRPCPPIRSMDS